MQGSRLKVMGAPYARVIDADEPATACAAAVSRSLGDEPAFSDASSVQLML